MDSQSKTGKVYLQPHKTGKKWKPVWLSLFPQSSSGVGRLEIQDIGGFRKKLLIKGKKKGNKILLSWNRSVVNHMWFSCGTSKGDIEALTNRWKCISHHVVNEHIWTDNDGKWHRCDHAPLTAEEQKRRIWLKKDSVAYQDLTLLVFDKRLLKDLQRMALFKHTGPMEIFHSALLQYLPKRQALSYERMRERCYLAIMEHNENIVEREQATTAIGGGAGGDHGAGVWKYHHPQLDRKLKVVRLSELLSVVRLPPNAEACPMENMSAFCVETQERTVVFAALKDDCVDWVKKLCHSMFQASDQFHMEDNQIYASADEDSEFWVVVQRTDAATRCGLQGSYWLQVGQEALLLKETQKKNIVREWPYKLLRRYGKDKLAFTIEAGRRCDSGPGSFTFETLQTEKIFSMIQSTIKQKTAGNQNQESEKGSNIQAHSPLPKIPDLSSAAIPLENQLRTQERENAALEESAHAPITLMPLPLIPTHGSQSGGQLDGQSEAVYSDPADCIQSVPKLQLSTGLYVDPAHVLPLQPPISIEASLPNSSKSRPSSDDDSPSSVYSEVYDKISTVEMKQSVQCSADGEPIYTEPMVSMEVSHKKETRPDPFAHLYAQVCKATPSCSSSSSSSCSASASCAPASTVDQSLDDVIYENLGII